MAMAKEQLITPRVDETEWVRQQEELASLFAKQLKMSRWQYLDTLPIFTPQPEEYRGRKEQFDTVVLVQPPTQKLSLRRILEISGLSYDPGVLKMEDWQGDKGGFKTPSVAYATWLSDGSNNLNVAPSVVRTNLAEDVRGGTGLDGVFLYVADRGVLRHHFLDLPGSQVGAGSVPYLRLWSGEPRLDCDWVGHADPYGGSVVVGRKIVTK